MGCLTEHGKTEPAENGRLLLIDFLKAGRDGSKLLVWDVEPEHKQLRGSGCCRQVGAVIGALRPGASIEVLVDVCGVPLTLPSGMPGLRSLSLAQLSRAFERIEDGTTLASHGFVPEIQLGPQVLPKCKFVNIVAALYASIGMPPTGWFKKGQMKCRFPVSFTMSQLLDILFDGKMHHIASRKLAKSKNKLDDPTQQLRCYQIIAKAHYDYLKKLWPDLDKFLDNKLCKAPEKRVDLPTWWDAHPGY